MKTHRITAAMTPKQRERERDAVLAAIFAALDAMRAKRAC
jgi:hypothetical protein